MRLHGALPPPAVIPARIIQPFTDRVAAASGGALAIQKLDAMALGATPVGMPVPAVPEALSKAVVDGTVIPWEITRRCGCQCWWATIPNWPAPKLSTPRPSSWR